MPIEDLMWVEKYRPTDLDDLVDQETIKQRLRSLMQKKEQLPHLLFAGPPGSGKTTTATIIAKEMLGDRWQDYTLSLNASVSGDTPVLVRVAGKARLVDFHWLANRYFRDSKSKYTDPEDLEVLSLDRTSLQPKFMRVANISRHRVPFIVEVDYAGGSVSATPDHSVMTLDDEGKVVDAPVSQLTRGDILLTFKSELDGNATEIPAPEFLEGSGTSAPADPRTGRQLASIRLDPESSWVFGSYLAEGCVSLPERGGGVTILTYRYPEELNLVDRMAYYLESTVGPYSHSHTIVSGSSGGRSGIQLAICSKKLARFLADHFYPLSAPKKTAHLKRVPDFMFEAPPELRREFLKGYMGDASRRRQETIRYSSKSKSCLIGTSWLARISGLHTSIFEEECRTTWSLPKSAYFVGELTVSKPFIRFFESLGRRVGFNWKYEMRHQLYAKKCKTVSKALVQKLLNRLDTTSLDASEAGTLNRLRALIESPLYAAPLTRVAVKRCEDYVYDLSVPGSETFWGGTTPVLLHNSDERGIDTVRQRIKTFARFADRVQGVPFRLVLLDEADETTNDAQTALRRIMEENSEHTRFILICNYSSGIIEPLQSRCAIFRFQRLDETAVARHLKVIARKEKLRHLGDSVFGEIYEATQGDLRQAINLMQAASASGELTSDAVKSVSGATAKARVSEIIETALAGNFEGAREKLVELTRVYGIPERDFLKYANEAVGSMDVPDLAGTVEVLAEYDFRLVQGSQPELQLAAMLARLSSLRRKAE